MLNRQRKLPNIKRIPTNLAIPVKNVVQFWKGTIYIFSQADRTIPSGIFIWIEFQLMDFFFISRHWKAFDCLFFCILPLLAPLKEEVAKKQSAFYYQSSTWWMLQWISRQREVMEQFPAASSSHPAPREYDRDLQCPSLSGEQEECTYLQVERWPRYAACEDERQDNSEARRNPIVQNAPPFIEKEVRGPQN